MRFRWACLAGALAAGCGTTAQPAASPSPEPPPPAAAPAAAPGPGPALRFDPGTAHRYRTSMTMGMEMPESEAAMGRIGLELEQEAVHRFEAPGPGGAPRFAVAPAWTRVVLSMEGPGIRFTMDSRDPTSLQMTAPGAPMAGLAEMFDGNPRTYEIHGRDFHPVDSGGTTPEEESEGDGPASTLGRMSELLLFAWVDMVPPEGADQSPGDIDLSNLPGFLSAGHAANLSFKVLERDAATGRISTEIRATMKSEGAGGDGPPEDPDGMNLLSGKFLIADVYERTLGAYASRRMEFEGEAKGGPGAIESSEGNTRVTLTLTVERLGDGAEAPAKGR